MNQRIYTFLMILRIDFLKGIDIQINHSAA